MGERFEEKHDVKFHALLAFLVRIPAVRTNETPWGGFASGEETNGSWRVKLSIDIRHPLAWHAVQELAHVLNYLSLEERLPSVFKPVSPPPYLNGGPDDFLSWVIEVYDADMAPETIAKWLAGRLPDPVDDLAQWHDNGDGSHQEDMTEPK